MQPVQNCIGPTIRIGREILCLPYAGFLLKSFFIGAIICTHLEIQCLLCARLVPILNLYYNFTTHLKHLYYTFNTPLLHLT